MTEIRYAEAADRDPWFRLDRHLSEEEFRRKVRDRRGYFLTEGGRPAGCCGTTFSGTTRPSAPC